MNPFKRAAAGFDSIIGVGQRVDGSLSLLGGSTTVIDGRVSGTAICVDPSDEKTNSFTSLVVNGSVQAIKRIEVHNVTVTGIIESDVLRVAGVLALKKGASVKCTIVQYGALLVEPGASLSGALEHLGSAKDQSDQSSE